jgi:hypothetical protein
LQRNLHAVPPSSRGHGWPNWSNDGKSLYFLDVRTHPGVFRIALNEHDPHTVVPLDGFRFTRASGAWFALTPDDDPLLLRNIGGGAEVYALPWEVP